MSVSLYLMIEHFYEKLFVFFFLAFRILYFSLRRVWYDGQRYAL